MALGPLLVGEATDSLHPFTHGRVAEVIVQILPAQNWNRVGARRGSGGAARVCTGLLGPHFKSSGERFGAHSR